MSGGAELERVANLRVRCATTVPSLSLPLVDRVRAPAGMFSGLRGRALHLSPKNTSSLLSISSHVSHRSSHQLLRLKHAGRKCTPISTKPSPSYFSRFFSDASGRGLSIGNCKSVLKQQQQQQQPRFFSSNGSAHWQHPEAQQLPVLSPPAVGNWLLLSSTLVIAVVVVGGVTRLTESGLSITE